MMISMRPHLLVMIIVLPLLLPVATAHGANSFSVIMRTSSIQPSEAELLQNDSLPFYNVADEERTIRTDTDGDGEYDQRCETEPSNSSSIRDECSFWISSNTWAAGSYQFDVFSNGTLWQTLIVTVIHDYHEESGPPTGYTFNNESSSVEGGNAIEWDGLAVLSGLLILVIVMPRLPERSGTDE